MKYNIFLNALFLLFSMAVLSQPNYPTESKKAQLIFDDVDRFVEIFNSLNATSDTIQLFEEKYFGQASSGLKEYVSRHGLTSTKLAEAIQDESEVYRKLVDKFPEMKKGYLKKYQKELTRYKEVIKDAMFPPTYFLVGANRGIAQASRAGQLVTIERSWDNPDRKFATIVHELTHFQQARTLGFGEYGKMYQKENNMLDILLREGGAEFITYKLVRKNEKEYDRLQYVLKNEDALKERLKTDLENQAKDFWLWASINQDEVPILLGYTMGYRICEVYYEKAVDKQQAIIDILGISDPQTFLEQSRYLK